MSSNVVFRKNGGFYSVYEDDCYILYYLFKYRIIDDRVGFPISAYNEVVNVLNENLINHEYNDNVVNYKKKNNYDKFVKLGKKKYNLDFRIKDIQGRKKLTDIWKEGGIEKTHEYVMITNDIYKNWRGFTAKEYKEHKGLRKGSLKDNMTDIEIVLADLGELATRDIALSEHPEVLKKI